VKPIEKKIEFAVQGRWPHYHTAKLYYALGILQ